MAGKWRKVSRALANEVGEVHEGTNSKLGLLAKPLGINFDIHN